MMTPEEEQKLKEEKQELRSQLTRAHNVISHLEKEVERFKQYSRAAEKNERIYKEHAAELWARVTRLYPDAIPSLREDENKESARHWIAGGY